MMTLNEYQDAARKTALDWSIDHMTMGLVEEAGEVAGVMKRVHRGDFGYRFVMGHNSYVPSVMAQDAIIKELGDVLWYAAMLADACGVRLEDVAKGNIKKLKDRAERKVLTGTGDNR
jgi:NTP pyrophosphatase (non-canonical NTP hydrolase)